ncbi:MAG: sulfite exporter TauE/SafE family protein [Nitratireductor sp.]|nr:sulfite exporter TauE/SafE family protein [Nitratireductor sp.]
MAASGHSNTACLGILHPLEPAYSCCVITQLADLYAFSGYQIILVACLIAGLVRGFAGFGTSMILMPVIAAVYSPQTAVVLVFLIDATAAIPVVIPELRRVEWKSLLPGFVGFLAVLPLGLAVLKFGDPVALRWALAALIILSVAVLWSGWRYHGPRSRAVDAAVGGVAGFTGGACGLPGPPAIVYWMAAQLKAATVRANTMVFLYLTDCALGAGLILAGILTMDGVIKGIGAMPFYLAGLLIGARGFGLASETGYRRIAFLIILVAAVTSLPLFDAVLR